MKGILKSFDNDLSIILDSCVEVLKDKERELGLVICRGKLINSFMSSDGYEEIENPFV